MKIIIVKYSNYPQENPHSYAVGFDISLQNGRGFYVDTLVNYDDIESGMSDTEVSTIAYNQLEEDIEKKVNQLKYAEPSIIGLSLDVTVEHLEEGTKLRESVDEVTEKVKSNTDVLDAMLGGRTLEEL